MRVDTSGINRSSAAKGAIILQHILSKLRIIQLELKEISYVHQGVTIKLDVDQIKNAPEFDTKHPIDMDYEKALYKHYANH